MAKVHRDRFGSSTPKITPADLEEDAAILTISGYEEVEVDDDSTESGKRLSASITTEELGDKVLWLNGGMIDALIEQLGDDSDDWIGQKIPVENYKGKFKGKPYEKVRVLPAEEWADAFKEAGVRRTPKPAPTGGKKRGK